MNTRTKRFLACKVAAPGSQGVNLLKILKIFYIKKIRISELTLDGEVARGLCLAHLVGGLDAVLATVLLLHVLDDQRESLLVGEQEAEAATGRHLLVLVVPWNRIKRLETFSEIQLM